MANPAAPRVSDSAAQTGVGLNTGTESSLSNWAGPYVTDMLGKGQALSNQGYQAYGGPLTAGSSALQNTAFQGIAGLTVPTDQMGAFNPQSFTGDGTAQKYMNPYLQMALDPQMAELQRQNDIANMKTNSQFTQAGGFGGGRQAVANTENQRNMLQQMNTTLGQGYSTAYDKAAQQFNTEQGRGQSAQDAANAYGLSALQKQADLGQTQRDIEQQGITADVNEFNTQREYPYKQVQYQQSLLQGLPLQSQTYSYSQPSALSQVLGQSGGIMDLYDRIFGSSNTTSSGTTGTGTGTTAK